MSEALEQSDPREGYKAVQLGPKPVNIPSEWEVRKLDHLTNNSGNYGANVSAVEYNPEKPRYIRITDIGDDGFLKDNDRKSISRNDAEGYYLSAGDLLFARTGATAGKSYLCKEDGTDAAYAGYLIRFELDESQVDTDFLALYVQSKLYDDWVDRITRHGAQQNINASEYRNLDVLYPPVPEQRLIADILSTVDEQIQQTDEIIEETKELKRGLIQDIFDLKTVSKSSNYASRISLGEIQQESLSDHISVISGVHVKSNKVSDDATKTPYLTGPDDFDEFGFSVTKFTDDPPKFCEPGDTLVTVKGSGCGKTTFANKRASISRQLKALRASESLDEHYLYYWMQTKQELLSILAQGTSIPGLSTSDLTTLSIPVPSMEKQTQIGDLLSDLDKKIHQEMRHEEKLQELKRGLMQDLLTGKVRVNAE